MITVGMNYQVREGTQKLFEEKFDAVIEALRQATGHVRSNLYHDVNDECTYLIISEWSEEKAFVEFIHSDMFKQVTDWGKEQILTGRPQHKIYKH
ncbi:MAG: antibiotic biosynthesis monooxygenase [Planctomycetes bacterium]|nr:antibiotic biosynthesis monooxygenase [Planctomycetota bacterium]